MEKTKLNYWIPATLSILTTVTWIVVTFMLIISFADPTLIPASRESLALIFATVTTNYRTVLDFWIGASESKENGKTKNNI